MKDYEQLSDEERDRKIDHLVDAGGMSYDRARQVLGLPFDELQQEPVRRPTVLGAHTVKGLVVKPKRRDIGAQYGDEEGVGYPEGEPPYYEAYRPDMLLDDDQIERNRNGAEAARRALHVQ